MNTYLRSLISTKDYRKKGEQKVSYAIQGRGEQVLSAFVIYNTIIQYQQC